MRKGHWGVFITVFFFIIWEAMDFAPRVVCILVKDKKLLRES